MATPSTLDAANPPSAPSHPPSSSLSSGAAKDGATARQQQQRRKRTRLDALADLPAFLLSVFVLYWSLPISVLLGRNRFLQFKGKRDDALGWAVSLQKLFAVRMFVLPGPTLLKDEACLYLANHRSWADFFLDVVATGGRAQMLSRAAVAVAFPAFMLAVCVCRSVILFRRDNVKDFEAFNAMIEAKMRGSPVDGLIVYPEGHRSTRPKPLPLKKGMLQFAWSRKLPVQVVASCGKEGVLSEKATSARWGRRVAVAYSVPVRPVQHADFDSFFKAVVSEWVSTWNRVAKEEAAPLKSASPMPEHRLDNREYPSWMLRTQVLVTGATVAAFLWTCAATARFCVRTYFSIPELVRPLVLLAVFSWCLLSAQRALGPPPCPPIDAVAHVDAKEYAEVMAAEAAASRRRRILKEEKKEENEKEKEKAVESSSRSSDTKSDGGNGDAAAAAAAASAAASDLADANGG